MIKYRGGKSKEIPSIMWHVPRFSGRYVEPFLGGGALFFHLEPRCAIINDINTKLMNFYRGVRDDYYRLRQELDAIEMTYSLNRQEYERLKQQTPSLRVEDKNEELYYKIRSMYNGRSEKEFSDAFLYYFINKTAYSGMIRYNSNGEFNVPFGRYAHFNTSSVTPAHRDLLSRTEILSTDYSEVFNLCTSDDFVFLDPPYDCIFSDYGNVEYKGGFDEDCHRRLAEDFRNLPCKSLMVIGQTPLTSELYKGYVIDHYEKNYAVNIRNRFKSSATHIIVTNYKKLWGYSPEADMKELETSEVCLFEAQHPYGNNKE